MKNAKSIKRLWFIGWSLFALVLVLACISFFYDSHEKALDEIESNLSGLIVSQNEDIQNFKEQFSIYSNPFDISSNTDFLKRVFVNGELVYWSDNQQIGEYADFSSVDSIALYQYQNSLFIAKRIIIPNRSALVEIYSLLPLFVTPPFSNEHLRQAINEDVFGDHTVRIKETGFTVVLGFHLPLSVKEAPGEVMNGIIFICFLLFVSIILYVIFEWLLSRYSKLLTTVGFGLVLIVSRGMMWAMTTYFLALEVFNPIHYTSSIGDSLGDAMLHGLVALVFVLVILRIFSGQGERIMNFWWAMLVIVCWNLALMALSELVWDLLNNSLITLDVSEDIHFDLIRSSAYILLTLWGATTFFLFVLFNRVFTLSNIKLSQVVLFYVPCAVLAAFSLRESGGWSIVIGGALFLLLGLSKLKFQFIRFDYKSFLYVSILFASIALIYALVIYKHHQRDDLVDKRRFANRLLIKNDFLGEYYLNQKISEVQSDSYIRTRLSNPLLGKLNVRNKIKRQYLSSYFDKYDVEVLLFDTSGMPIDGAGKSYKELYNEFAKTAFATDYEHIFFIEDTEEYVQDRYYCFVPINSFNKPVGYVVLRLVLKKYIPRSVFPQLMVASGSYLSDDSRYDYAAYREGKLLYKRGRFEFQNQLTYPDLVNPKLYTEGIEKSDFHFYGLETSEGKVFVIASPKFRKKAILSNFSFFFLLLLFCFGLYFVVFKLFNRNADFNLSTKIQLYLGLSFLIPMLIVSIALLNTLNTTYREEIDASFSTKSYNISEYLTEVYERFLKDKINRDELANAVSEVSSLIQSDINIYATDGQLMISSEIDIFNLGLLGKQIAPEAFNAIKYGNAESKIFKQQIGDLVFSVAYVGLRSYRDGQLLGIMSMPYFDSKKHLFRQQIEVFNDLISVFTIIFLFSVVIGNVVIGKLVKPLKMITQRLKLTDFREVNQPLEYDSHDEIGALISEYNLMIVKLEESKAALAENQKELAWKEIARQVAHEIKNPLTPMRLKVQQMMRQKERDSQEYKMLDSLIAQIDVLSAIADSFSAFARMPAPKNEKVDLRTILEGVMTLHQGGNVVITNHSVENPLWVYVDPTIFSGIFNNIILNAIQSVGEGEARIDVLLKRKLKKVVVSFHDNGSGIAEEDRDRIFTPYFSTKITGSGIGLAVAKKGIENAGGNIWFETKEGVGTTFYISIPLVD